MSRRKPEAARTAGPSVGRLEFLAARNYLFAVCFSPEPEAGPIEHAWEEWQDSTPPARLEALRTARGESMRAIGVYWGQLWDQYIAEGGTP